MRTVFLVIAIITSIAPYTFGVSARSVETIVLHVNASEVTRKILHCKLIIPVKPGTLRLVYPKWVPGDHRPDGPITDLVGLRFTIDGQAVDWRRDLTDMYAFAVAIPDTANRIEVEYDLVGSVDAEIWHLARSTTWQLTVLNWNQVVLYPEGRASNDVVVQASLQLPVGWKFASALPIESNERGVLTFQPVTLTTLVDSPLIAGSHFREVDITPPSETVRHFVDVVGDSEGAMQVPKDEFAKFTRLVNETGALFGARHYESYRFLVSLQGNDADGNEHHQSSDNRLPELGLVDPEWRMLHGALFAHEMVHSWNGKYRRPLGLATSDYQQPMKGDLLWVYEGLTSYLGRVLATRSGFLTPEQTREAIAEESAAMSWPGREWRPLLDTAVAAQLLYNAPSQWNSWRRGTDFYEEGALVWLEVDTIIRTESKGTKSLDDFCRHFAGGRSGPPEVITYTFADITAELNAVLPYNWQKLLTDRLTSRGSPPPFGGIERSGWRLVFRERIPEFARAEESLTKQLDARYSLGTLIAEDGTIVDAIEGGPAARAGVAPGMKLVTINSRKYTPDTFRQELRAAETVAAPIELLVSEGQYFKTLQIDYHGGERYPQLEREGSKPDLLDSILASRSR